VQASEQAFGGVMLDVVAQRCGGRLKLWVDDTSGSLRLMSDRNMWRLKNDAADPAQATLPRAVAIAAVQAQAQAQALGLRRLSIPLRAGGAKAHERLADLSFSNIQGEMALQATIPSRFQSNGVTPNDITALRASADGRAWWREHGKLANNLSFDLTPGSASWQTPQAYLRVHKIRLPAGVTVPRAAGP
jgi:hypothetical protein